MRKSVNVENVNVLCVNPTMDNSPEEITAAVQRLADRAGLNMSQFAKRLGYKAARSIAPSIRSTPKSVGKMSPGVATAREAAS